MRWKDVLMSDSAEIENPLAARSDHRDHTEPCRPTQSAFSAKLKSIFELAENLSLVPTKLDTELGLAQPQLGILISCCWWDR